MNCANGGGGSPRPRDECLGDAITVATVCFRTINPLCRISGMAVRDRSRSLTSLPVGFQPSASSPAHRQPRGPDIGLNSRSWCPQPVAGPYAGASYSGRSRWVWFNASCGRGVGGGRVRSADPRIQRSRRVRPAPVGGVTPGPASPVLKGLFRCERSEGLTDACGAVTTKIPVPSRRRTQSVREEDGHRH